MDPARWQQIRRIFENASDLPQGERAAFLDQACDSDPSLRAEIDALLGADATARFDAVAVADVAPDLLNALSSAEQVREDAALIGRRLGPWRLVREIGRGGMGAVYLAERDDGEFRQQAAIKLVRPGWDLGELLQRLRAERQILASLNHPNIARLLDGGVSEDGKPYLVLEFVDGSQIGDYCDRQQLGIGARLKLFLAVCDAVAYAHRSLVVHRDLKPSNILVGQDGQVKLLDFGIAKLLAADGAAAVSALRMFTPEYAAPEQVRGEPVTTGVDVYALGLLLFELLTGRRPYAITGSTPAAYEQAILTAEPTRPSRAALTVSNDAEALARARQLDPASLSARLRGDLDAIVLKALRKEPAQRYASVTALAEDVMCYLDQRPVAARRGNLRYRATRFLQRHALSTSLAVIALLSLLAGLGSALWQAEEARQQRDRASTQAARAEQLSTFLVGIFNNANPFERGGAELSAKELLDVAVERIRSDRSGDPLTRLALMRAMASSYFGLGLPNESLLLAREIVDQGRPLAPYPEWDDDLLQLATNLRETGKAPEALPLAEAAIAAATSQTPVDEAVIARALYIRALANYSMQQRDLSDQLFGELLELLRANPQIDPGLYEDTRLMVSRRLGTKGDFVAAEAMVKSVIDDIRADAPLREADLISALDALGSLYDKMKRHDEQVAVYRELLPMALRKLGPDHFHVGIAHHNLAQALEATGVHPESLTESDEAVRIGRASVGVDHSFTVAARIQRARAACRVNGRSAIDADEHQRLEALVADRFPNYRQPLVDTRSACGMPAP